MLKSLNLEYIILGNLLFYTFVVLSGIAGTLISERVDREKFLELWIVFGMIVTFLIPFFQGLEFTMLLSALLGISFGLGWPSCQAIFTEKTKIEDRGKTAGIAVFITFFTLVLVQLLPELLGFGLIELVIICLILKGSGIITLKLDKSNGEEKIKSKKEKSLTWIGTITSSNFGSYALPWFIFHITNGIALFGTPSETIAELAMTGLYFTFLGALFTFPIAGIFVDRIGRRQPMFIGLLALGVSYGLFGIVTNELTYLIFNLVNGIAWGLLAVSYMIVILSDLSSKYWTKERFYTLGGILIPLLTFTLFSSIQQWYGIEIPLNLLSSILGIVILLSAYPVFRADETLPTKIIKEREIKEHIERVKDIINEE